MMNEKLITKTYLFVIILAHSFNVFNNCSDFNILQLYNILITKVFGQDITMQKKIYFYFLFARHIFRLEWYPRIDLDLELFINNNEHV